MAITSNASPDEKLSPFYMENEALCLRWHEFAKEHNGKCNAIYNAWSFDIKIKLTADRTWLIFVKKGTYSNASIWFSSRWQNLREIIEFQANFQDTDCPNFHISPTWWKNRRVNHPFYDKIKSLVQKEKQGKDRISASFKQGRLTLTFHHRNNDFDLAKTVLQITSVARN